MGASREGFRKHLRVKGRAPDPEQVELVQVAYRQRRGRFGVPKICAAIREMVVSVTRKTVAKILKVLGIFCTCHAETDPPLLLAAERRAPAAAPRRHVAAAREGRVA